ncbi:hypothetical protein GCM10022252_14090 [Streptosporangium oxazolinicum]|uniref:Uncharacterized protein n=1 Tax=Streptosporangium oxazolinicum TaxID=909287 RepID=A0ABP8AJ62_9ACTN
MILPLSGRLTATPKWPRSGWAERDEEPFATGRPDPPATGVRMEGGSGADAWAEGGVSAWAWAEGGIGAGAGVWAEAGVGAWDWDCWG